VTAKERRVSSFKYDLLVVGLGYVGLPLVAAATRAGLNARGFDTSPAVVEGLNAGRSHVDDLSDDEIAELGVKGFEASSDPDDLSLAECVVICVPTPLSVDGGPDLGAVRGAAKLIAEHLQPGQLVVLESTTWPGTTEQVVGPILEGSGLTAGRDFNLAFSPERIDPGNPLYGIGNTPKVVGGLTGSCAVRASEMYGRFVDSIVLAKGCREAEMAKLLENTYRHINIALVNEMAKFSHELGIDFWNVIECAKSKPFGFQAFYPGPGVGGHCIPIDPNYLSHHIQAQLGYPFRFVELAQEINNSMPQYVVKRVQDALNDLGKPVKNANVLLLGVTYKPGIADERESPARPLAIGLRKLGANLSFFDSFVEEWTVGGIQVRRVEDVGSACEVSDIVVLLQPHESYGQDVIVNRGTPILDTRGSLVGASVIRL
jgi:UDP-N-acetyl-D-glucosamine dehydrogenase